MRSIKEIFKRNWHYFVIGLFIGIVFTLVFTAGCTRSTSIVAVATEQWDDNVILHQINIANVAFKAAGLQFQLTNRLPNNTFKIIAREDIPRLEAYSSIGRGIVVVFADDAYTSAAACKPPFSLIFLTPRASHWALAHELGHHYGLTDQYGRYDSNIMGQGRDGVPSLDAGQVKTVKARMR